MFVPHPNLAAHPDRTARGKKKNIQVDSRCQEFARVHLAATMVEPGFNSKRVETPALHGRTINIAVAAKRLERSHRYNAMM
jgi:hypothetical protein